jgi:hypothetical protein
MLEGLDVAGQWHLMRVAKGEVRDIWVVMSLRPRRLSDELDQRPDRAGQERCPWEGAFSIY